MSDKPLDDSSLVVTRDGSHTVYSKQFDQHYHNPNGAIAESRYVFFEQPGLLDELAKRDQLTILEVGFGTGLNLLLLADYLLSTKSAPEVDYYSIEGFPLSPDVATNFNYRQQLNHPNLQEDVTNIFDNLTEGMNHFEITEHISVHLFHGMFSDFMPRDIKANYIFHDAFSPDSNPELWTGEVFKKLKKMSADDVILTTYSSASKAQGALSWAGWKVAKTKGALGKREMILAALDPNRLEGLKRINEERYAWRYEEGDFE
jgi:tRNA U34 5-methylaminomethyl-2-thiouridine-forming methyltransferase MnmC